MQFRPIGHRGVPNLKLSWTDLIWSSPVMTILRWRPPLDLTTDLRLRQRTGAGLLVGSAARRSSARGVMEQRWGLPLIAWPSRLRPNYWDLVALPLVLGLLALIAWGGMAMGTHYQLGEVLPISLDP